MTKERGNPLASNVSYLISEVDIAIGLAATTPTTRSKLRDIREGLVKLRSDLSARLDQEILLTKREREILNHLAGSENLSEIAAALFISSTTLKSHTQAIYRKLGAANRRSAVARAGEIGLLKVRG